MHIQCCDVTYDITAPFNDVTSANKMTHFGRTVPKAHPSIKLPKMAIDSQEHHSNGTPRLPGVPCNATHVCLNFLQQ